jgi:hypothetical protein
MFTFHKSMYCSFTFHVDGARIESLLFVVPAND